jgi:hypothetical protein
MLDMVVALTVRSEELTHAAEIWPVSTRDGWLGVVRQSGLATRRWDSSDICRAAGLLPAIAMAAFLWVESVLRQLDEFHRRVQLEAWPSHFAGAPAGLTVRWSARAFRSKASATRSLAARLIPLPSACSWPGRYMKTVCGAARRSRLSQGELPCRDRLSTPSSAALEPRSLAFAIAALFGRRIGDLEP